MLLTDELPMDVTEFGMQLPPVPDHIQERVKSWGGNNANTPNVRIVSGTDPEIVEWCAGRWIPRYTFPQVETVHYAVWHKPDGTKKILTPAEAKIRQNSKKFKGIVIPVTQNNVKDNLIPRYFVEVFKSAEYFGNKETWDSFRMDTDLNGNPIDLMGEFPENGKYETWFCIEDVIVNEKGKPVKSVFRGLDDEVLEYIRLQIEDAKGRTLLQQHQKATEEARQRSVRVLEEIKSNIRDKISDRIDRIVQTPSTLRIK